MKELFTAGIFIFYFLLETDHVSTEKEKTIYYKDLELFNFRRVSSIQYIHVDVPEDTIHFTWNIVLNNSHTSCESKISLLAKYGSFPISTSYDDSSYPSDYVQQNTHFFNTIFSQSPSVVIKNPLHGQWFLGAVLPPHLNNVVKNLLEVQCTYGIYGNITLTTADVETIATKGTITLNLNKKYNYYRFLITSHSYKFEAHLSNCNFTESSAKIAFASGHPPDKSTLQPITCDQSSFQDIEVTSVETAKWQYILITHSSPSSSSSVPSIDITITTQECVVGLLREHKGEIPCYITTDLKASLPADDVQQTTYGFSDQPEFLVVPRSHVSLTPFEVSSFRDVGGFLNFHFEMTAIAPAFNKSFEAKVCVQRGFPPITTDHRLFCHTPQALITLKGLAVSNLKIAYPEAGVYYIAYQDNSQGQTNLMLNDSGDSNSSFSNVTYGVLMKVELSQCEFSKCQNNGKCGQLFKGAFLMSSCFCIARAKGFSCADTSEMVSASLQLFFTFLLTLSNLAFLPAIIVAFYRLRYVECMIYTLNMIFSTFYHACDMNSWSLYGYCIAKYGTLQFADFMLSLLSFWFTLIAMSRIQSAHILTLSTFGVVVVAILMHYNSTGVWRNVIPIASGAILVIVTWSLRMWKTRSLYPQKKDYRFIVPGILLALAGIIVFSVFEDDINYPYTHSFWHLAVALSVPLMLPPYKSTWKFVRVDTWQVASDVVAL